MSLRTPRTPMTTPTGQRAGIVDVREDGIERRWVRRAVKLGFLVFIGGIAVVLVAVYALRQHTAEPDVAAVAAASQVAAADALAQQVETRLLSQAIAGQTWLSSGPSALVDSCASTPPSAIGESWGPVTCDRTATTYFGFNGDFVQELRTWETHLTVDGWSKGNLDQVIAYYDLYEGKAEPGDPARAYSATALPRFTSAYSTPNRASAGQFRIGLSINWAERPTPNAALSPEARGKPASQSGTAVRNADTVDAAAVQGQLFASHRYVAIVSLDCLYFGA